MLLISDIHIGLWRDDKKGHNLIMDLFREIADLCIKKDIKKIAILGDLFNNRKSLTSNSKDTALEVVNILKNFELIITSGNHDIYYNNSYSPNWLELFYYYDNITVVDKEPYFINDCCFVPWGYPIDTIEHNGYLFGHFEINSFMMNDSFECTKAKLNISDFKKFKHVYSGHFHHPSTKNNITYLGSPFQHNFGDCESKRGYYIFINGNIEFIEFTSAPKFIILKPEDNIAKENIENNFVKMIFNSNNVNKADKLISLIESFKPLSLDIKVIKNETVNQKILEEEGKTNKEIYMEFVEKNKPDYIDYKLIDKVFDSILKDINFV